MTSKTYRYIANSFGGGVQSTAIYLMLCHEPEKLLKVMGHLPNVSIFADTLHEPCHVYRHIQLLQQISCSIPLVTVEPDKSTVEKFHTYLPLYIRNEEGKQGKLRRQCTERAKIRVIRRDVRVRAGLKPKQRVAPGSIGMWLGISTDEIIRMKPSQAKAFENLYPLIELGMSRDDCVAYCEQFGIIPPKSRCSFCPFIKDWKEVALKYPDQAREAILYDRQLRDGSLTFKHLRSTPYIHRSLRPLDEVISDLLSSDLPSEPDNGFMEECSGTCGL